MASSGALQAQIEQVTLRVDGLACPFCAYGLEKKLKKLEGVRAWHILLNEGKAVLTWRPEKPLDYAALVRAVKKAGFTLRTVTARVVGVISKERGQYVLQLSAPVNQRLVLRVGAVTSKRASGRTGQIPASGADMRQRLQQWAGRKARVSVVGPVQPGPGKRLTLAVLEVSAADGS